MVLFLTSDVGASVKIDGKRVVTKLNNKNGFVDNLKKYVSEGENFVFVVSNPDTFDKNDSYGKLTFDSFNLSGFNFSNLKILDSRTIDKAEEYIKNSSIVFLGGGVTKTQMEFFNKIGLSSLLKKYAKIIIGQSAGALNLAEEVYNSPEDEEEQVRYFKGLGLTNINIEPHFKNNTHLETETLGKILLEDSKTKSFIAIPDGSYIIDDGNEQVLYGEGYYFDIGKYKQICSNGNYYFVNDIIDKVND